MKTEYKGTITFRHIPPSEDSDKKRGTLREKIHAEKTLLAEYAAEFIKRNSEPPRIFVTQRAYNQMVRQVGVVENLLTELRVYQEEQNKNLFPKV